MSTVIISLFAAYLILLIVLVVGWSRSQRSDVKVQLPDGEPLVSIVVPARNEAHRIGHLLSDLQLQHYANFQVIVVDDQSEDRTYAVVAQYTAADNRFRVVKSTGAGKKRALTQGIMASQGSIIVTTDADCRVAEGWIQGLSQYFATADVKMVVGAVRMVPGTPAALFSEIQSMEFMSLIGVAAASAGLGAPIMCNGANLAFRRQVFDEVGGYDGNLHIPSGDDEFLMRKISTKYSHGIVFAADKSTIVTTAPNSTLNEFVQQRIRWAGKWKYHQSMLASAIALLVFCFQASLVIFPILAYFNAVGANLGLLYFIKAGGELLYLWRVALFLRLPWNWPAFIILQVIYPFYTVTIGFLASFSTFVWKGRSSSGLSGQKL